MQEAATGIRDHDFAILVFSAPVQGSSQAGDFSYESMTAAQSLTYSINCAGYLNDYDDITGVHLWKNEKNGSVLALESLPLSGNDFKMNLSIVQGMSGGPVFRTENGRYIAVGIISHMNTQSGWNAACRITERLQVLIAWANNNGFNNITPSGSVSPSTGIDDLTGEEIEEQVCRQFALQSIDPSCIEVEFKRARAMNPEVVAWLYVPGTSVSLPVCRHEGDDGFYLEHDYRGQDSPLGSAYMEEGDSAAFDQPLTVLYAHSFSDYPLMFTGLHAFEDLEFFKEHELIYVYTEEGLLTYGVIEAALYTSEHIESLAQESDEGALQSYMDAFADDDPHRFIGYRKTFDVDASADRVLQLSTCTVPAMRNGRFVVSAVLVQ